MVENLKSELKNGKEIINSVEVIKIENEIAIKLKVFNVLYEPQ
jgi:hypothetical protein